MLTKSIFICICAGIAAITINANAALIDISASSTDSRITDFTLQFNDLSGDGLLQINEVVQFSGFRMTSPVNSAVNGIYDVILGTPDITGISKTSGIALFAATNWNFKRYQGDLALCCSSKSWTYDVKVVPATLDTIATPIPGAAWLFGSGLIGLTGLAARKVNRFNV